MATQGRDRPYVVLFLCTGNSARSIFGEAILNRIGMGQFLGYSAGSHPARHVNPHVLALLNRLEFPTETLRCKSFDEFAQPGAPQLDFVLTLCDNAANEVCPVWPGQPVTAHWSVPNPTTVEGDAATIARAFSDSFLLMRQRLEHFVALPMESLDQPALRKKLDAIGKSGQPI